ncbi:SDR family NAD(P)-dependent oxidoreductase [Falsiruegeria mediterranea]|uniref:C-factor n=1 Tax=Falsiruegeria mediterranea M17 TaxID=1200281 RepID=A0A2R8CCW3_9RHOB|nr:SDR family NAD(P)-dependent oxidoreductase [Falsiruegeria mediterranea]SPJ30255.1 C-factor [Falsiruegeria mediterranea M17]
MHILITGANRGIGKEISKRYRADGHTVTGTARDGSETVTLDVTDPAQHREMAEQMSGKPVDLLICNAGVYLDKAQEPDGYPAEMWAQTFAANITGVFLTVQALMPNLELADGARIAIISSQMASHTRAPGGSYIYRASKAAALNLGRNLSADLKPKGIAVGIYHPGWVRTDMGGAEGDISVDEAAEGLIARFAELDLASTGCFKTWDGRDHAY